jgi:glycosyltransferase involved in cell wall biosynthesis
MKFTSKDVSFILPTRNTLPYTKMAYESLRKYNPESEIIIMDDLSTDGTNGWLDTINHKHTVVWKNDHLKFPRTYDDQLFSGHTLLYNLGIQMATGPVVGIFHSDMVCSQNFTSNLLKHLNPKTIVSATRIEPPVYPTDNIKFTENFGIYHNEFKLHEFEKFVETKELIHGNKITNNFFAPWIMFQDDYLDIGGMDSLYAPYPIEDSDFIERLYGDGYDIIQSWDSYVWHFCSRGHRWTTGKVQVDTDQFNFYQSRGMKVFVDRWKKYPNPPNYNYVKSL